MNLRYSDSILIKTLIYAAAIFLAVKSLWLVTLVFLPKHSIEKKEIEKEYFYEKFNVSKALNIKPFAKKESKPVTIEDTYKLENIKLKAVYIEKDKSFIAIEDKNILTFVDLNEIYRGYKLIKIYPNRAIFEKNSKHYEIAMNEDKISQFEIEKTKKQKNIKAKNKDEKSFKIKKTDILRYTTDFGSIWKNIQISDYKKNGKIEGFKIGYIKKGSVFDSIGLKSGDIIIAANNRPLKSNADAFYFYKRIKKIDALKLTILRDGVEEEIEYEVR